jgi:putative flippase GtrA
MRFTDKRFLRFVICGGLNTLLGYLIYLMLLSVADYRVAFTLSFLISIVFAYGLNARFVFDVKFSWRTLSRYPIVYIIQYVLGFLLLTLEVNLFGFDKRFCPLLNVAIQVPVTFLLNKWFLIGSSK